MTAYWEIENSLSLKATRTSGTLLEVSTRSKDVLELNGLSFISSKFKSPIGQSGSSQRCLFNPFGTSSLDVPSKLIDPILDNVTR